MQPSPVAPTAPTSRRRTLGLIGLAVGLVGGGLSWYLAGQQSDDGVAALAPAPVGCDTTLDFDSTGTYTFYVETRGEVGEIDGNCDDGNRSYEFTGDGLPRISLTLVDADGREVDLDRVDSPSYDANGAVGTGIRTADIDIRGEYVLTVEANADDVMVRVGKGRDPAGSSSLLATVAIVLVVAGLASAIVGFLTSRGRGAAPSPPDPAAPVWSPIPGQPAPIAPPVAPPAAPPYAWPPGTPPAPPSAPPQQAQPGWPGTGGTPPPPPPGR